MQNTNKNSAPSPRQVLNDQGVLRIPARRSHPKVTHTALRSQHQIKIGTWNVNSMFEAGKIHNTIQEMTRLKIGILGVSEMWWPLSGKRNINNHVVYYSGNEDKNHRNGVGIIITKNIEGSVINFVPFSDRLMLLQLKGNPININLIQAYAPTADKSEIEIERFYEDLKELLKITKSGEVTIILGDFNAKIGKGRVENIVGEYGLGERSDRGDRLVQFCQEENLVVTNTWFQLPLRRLYTWTSPQHSEHNCIRNQIDYILIKKRFRNNVVIAKTYPGADVTTDHTLLCAVIRVRLKKKEKSKKQRTDITRLKDVNTKHKVTQKLNMALNTITANNEDETTESLWQSFRSAITKTEQEQLNSQHPKRHKPWITEEILQLMQERRHYKTTNRKTYKEIHRTIRQKIREAKENWAKEKCEEIERLQLKHDSFNIHKKVKEMAGMSKTRVPQQLRNSNNKIVTSPEELKTEWTRYVQDLFQDDREQHPEFFGSTDPSPCILRAEVEHAIKNIKTGKAPGPDNIHAEILQLINEENLTRLTQLYNRIYETGQIPKDWLKSTFIPLPKTRNPKTCSDYRLISLMSHALKVFLKIIHHRIYKKCEMDMGVEQFGFRHGFGTREALFSVMVLAQKCRDQRKDLFICFIDYEKAFDKVRHNTLLKCLTKKGLDKNDIDIIKNLYWSQEATVTTEAGETEALQIRRGVRQGCVLSPLLFNLYTEEVFSTALQTSKEGIKINGKLLNNIRYADDTIIIAENNNDLQNLLTTITDIGEEYGLRINARKTKVMVISRAGDVSVNIYLKNQKLEQVDKYKYLGCWINQDINPEMEIRARIEQARTTFLNMRRFMCDRNMSLSIRYRMVKAYVHSTLLYGMEAWTLNLNCMRRLEAFEMWTFRRLQRVPWTEHATNVSILERMGRDREMLTTVKRRKAAYMGHILRNNKYELLQLIIKGKIEGRRGPGRRQISWMRNIREWTGMDTQTLIRIAENREEFALVIANLR